MPKVTGVKKTAKKLSPLSVPVYSLAGVVSGSLELPKELFGAKVNKDLLAQALRVYQTNRKAHWSNTKTRGEVSFSTAKIYRQKGTGRARHGAKSAPIFVHFGGVALGPKHRKTELELPKKMKDGALVSALSQKMSEGEVLALSSTEKSSGKTRETAKLLSKLGKKSALIVAEAKSDNLARSIRNLIGVRLSTAQQVNAFEVIKHQSLILTKEAVAKLEQRVKKEAKKEESQ